MTQPAVSQHIQDLERSLGMVLFTRGRRGVTLTPVGETLHDYTQRILRLVAEAEADVTNVENLEEGQITIGATPGVSTYLLPSWLAGFRETYPNLQVKLQTGITSSTVTDVMEHNIDIGFIEGELEKVNRSGLGSLVLRPVDLFVVVGKDHKWATRDSVTVDMLNDQPMITRQPNSRTRVWTDAILKQHGVTPRIVGEYDNQEAIKQTVMSNMGITILPDYSVAREAETGLMHLLRVTDAPLHREIKLIWDSTAPIAPITRALMRYLSAQFPQIGDIK